LFLHKKEDSEYFRYQGRKISKRLSPSYLNLLKENYDKYSFDEEILSLYKLNNKKKFLRISNNRFKKTNIEIGFGDGEYLLKSAISRPDELFIGSEVYINGIAKVLRQIINLEINNIKLSKLNCIYLLKVIQPKSIDMITIINPDPWLKKRHHKRRLISCENIRVLTNLTKSKNSILITTDSEGYVQYIKNIFSNNNNLSCNLNLIVLEENNNLYGVSRYQRKALREGKKIYLLTI